MTDRLKRLIDFLDKAFPQKEQTFFTRNTVGDAMEVIYDHDDITVELCVFWGYIEVFGLTDAETKVLEDKGFNADTGCMARVYYDFIDTYLANEEADE